ncbi:ABC transporter ATP-binding protein [Bosea caraganae]|uniref:ABC transporter ATP-binding protein n=1 Tax=Bosea caraganae TaxID=2763117 RepID=A0A370L1J2_9HYPH|nr:ABC transporter ATP-binding protein [Bosea caraganae]RDJ21420.1 ABC transporter ATP-binding protein [Bosea caraganae]RDJ23388.1 ABC transporter ATP-binding protein [Bosea caraganae]
MAKAGPASVEFRNVSMRYGSVTAVDNVNFTIEAGKLVTLLGPSGCGKTTTLRMIAGLEIASEGQILIGGKDVTKLSAADRDVSMVFQSYALFPHMSVLENAAYGPTVKGLGKEVAREMAMAKLALVGLKGFENRYPSELSGGQQQRVAVARALVLEPQVLLFDEPLSNLDAKLRRRVREEIRELQQNLNLTVAYVTHDQEEALAVSDRIIVMSNSRIAQEGSPRDLYERPANAFVADFIGDANLIDVTIKSVADGQASVAIGPATVPLPSRELQPGPAKVAIRPESLLLSKVQDASVLPGTIRKCAYLGNHLDIVVDTPVGDLFVIQHGHPEMLEQGAPVWLSFAKSGVTLIPPA